MCFGSGWPAVRFSWRMIWLTWMNTVIFRRGLRYSDAMLYHSLSGSLLFLMFAEVFTTGHGLSAYLVAGIFMLAGYGAVSHAVVEVEVDLSNVAGTCIAALVSGWLGAHLVELFADCTRLDAVAAAA
eukprot:TRINITY_DN15567_c0_g2_i1.p2 TRINITY_DN15567_c0_g2~~TRINITY_DN15567_c0_g2_i1.p2  ORF type:complete len:127 (+),score=17.42 TRINITY_DN15567_c0_g2_i1:450-830(+)